MFPKEPSTTKPHSFDEARWVINVGKSLDAELEKHLFEEVTVRIFTVPRALMCSHQDSYTPQKERKIENSQMASRITEISVFISRGSKSQLLVTQYMNVIHSVLCGLLIQTFFCLKSFIFVPSFILFGNLGLTYRECGSL